jgi:sugar-specific transcriptional regulator TrmB
MESSDLEKLGLNKNEAKVYYTLLKIGSSSAANLVKHMGIHRNIIYDNLEKLITKGLVSYIVEESKKLFIPQQPSAILEYLEKKEEEIASEREIAKKLILEIKDLKKDESIGQEAEIYRGIKGMKKVLSEVLIAKENLVLGMTNKSSDLLGETYWKNYNAKIKDRRIKERLLLNSDFNDIYSFNKNKLVQVKILPKEFNQVTEIILFDEKVAIFIYSDNPLVFLIKDKILYQTYLQQFEFLWKIAKK